MTETTMADGEKTAGGALAGIKVLDLSRILAGPWASQVLGDLGAEVIKVERPGEGDDTRKWGPPWLADGAGEPTDQAAYYLAANRNKTSVTIDFTRPEGQALVRRLAAQSDILIENYKVGGLAKYGLDYDSLKAVNPRLIYCSITGFGQTGPYAARPGYDLLLQGMGGLMSITGPKDGRPQRAGVAVVDLLTGLYGVVGVLAALAARERTGEGQHIDLALLDVEVACLANQASNFLVSGVSPGRMGNAHPNIVPYQEFPTADGFMIVAVGNDSQFRAFAGVLGHGEWGADPAYATNPARVANRDVLVPLIEALTPLRTTHGWVEALEAAGVPCGPINAIGEVFDDPQVRARGLRVEMAHEAGGTAPGVASPLRMSGTPVEYRHAPPVLGQHTQAVLAGLGLSADEIADLRARGVV
jgi:crotonobetainyl-CoA:carnitine CoA-transferase CaiB-like acyl-CoA transferase